MHILSPETDNCPSWISGRERMTIENISWSISRKECCRPRRGSNPRPPGLQSDAHPTEPPRLALPCPSLSSLLLSLLSLFSLSLGDNTKWPTRVDMSLNPNTINLYKRIYCWYSFDLPQLVEAIQMITYNIHFYKEIDNSTPAVIWRLKNCLTVCL